MSSVHLAFCLVPARFLQFTDIASTIFAVQNA